MYCNSVFAQNRNHGSRYGGSAISIAVYTQCVGNDCDQFTTLTDKLTAHRKTDGLCGNVLDVAVHRARFRSRY